MRKKVRQAVAAVLVAAGTLTALPAAMAADEPISVVVDGQTLAFDENAQPVIRDGRTYVPFRTIFSAMGMEIGWDAQTKTVSASRDQVTAQFAIGQATVTVNENGRVRTLQTDAPPILLDGNTMVPVRFAAQAFGAGVGWDAPSRTAMIVDVDKLRAAYQGQFTTMERYMAFAAPAGTQTVNAEFNLALTLQGATGQVQVPINATGYGVWGADGGNLTVRFKADTAALQAAMAANDGAIDSGLAKLLLSMQDVSFDCIMDLTKDTMYLKSAALTSENIPADAWVKLPLDKTLGLLTSGRVNAAMLNAMARHDYPAYIAGVAQNTALAVGADNVAAVRAVFDQHRQLFGDQAFLSGNNQLVASTSAGAGASASLVLDMDNTAIAAARVQSNLTQNGRILFQSTTEQDASGKTILSVILDGTAYDAQLDGEISIAPTTQSATLTPAGVVVGG